MSKRYIFFAIALISMATISNAQFSVYNADGEVQYTTRVKPAYIDFTYHDKGFENGHEWVDLGLSDGTLWATCNIGAENPEDYGDYYAWGELESKTSYNVTNYFDYKNDKYLKYNTTGGKTILEDVDDVAIKKWGGRWKIPTYSQQLKLRTECYCVWTTTYNQKPICGVIVFKKKAGGSYDVTKDIHIFLPAAGYYIDTNVIRKWKKGNYFSRALDKGHSSGANNMGFTGSSKIGTGENPRYYGQIVRACFQIK